MAIESSQIVAFVDANGNPIGASLTNPLPVTGATSGTVDTELPAAAALADAAANPTAPLVGSCLQGFNGATWDRARFPTRRYDLNAVSITAIATVATPTLGKRMRVLGGSISVSVACSVLFEDNSAGNGMVWRTPQLLANTPYNFDLGPVGCLLAAVNNLLKATGSTGTPAITGTIYATEES